jgi:hypothetical protein
MPKPLVRDAGVVLIDWEQRGPHVPTSRSSIGAKLRSLTQRPDRSDTTTPSWKKLKARVPRCCCGAMALLCIGGISARPYSGRRADDAAGCDSTPCQHNGVCMAENGGAHTYKKCTNGWDGVLCEHSTGCDSKLCGEHADNCTADGGTHACACKAGWKGIQDCASPTGCDLAPCGVHGTGWAGLGACTAYGGAHCSCKASWSGDQHCNHPTGCDASPHCGHSTCVAQGGSHTCS